MDPMISNKVFLNRSVWVGTHRLCSCVQKQLAKERNPSLTVSFDISCKKFRQILFYVFRYLCSVLLV